MEGLDDPSRGMIRLAGERLAISDGPGIPLGVRVAREGNGGERFLGDAVVVHPPRRLERAFVCRRHQTIGKAPGQTFRRASGEESRTAPESLELALGERAEDENCFRMPPTNGCVGEVDRGRRIVSTPGPGRR